MTRLRMDKPGGFDERETTTDYHYDLAGNRMTRVTDAVGSSNDETISYSYDADDRLLAETSTLDSASYFQKLWTAATTQAAFRSPSTNTTPSIRSCSFSAPFSFRQRPWAFLASLNAIARPAWREPGP